MTSIMNASIPEYTWPFDDTRVNFLYQDSRRLLDCLPHVHRLHAEITKWCTDCYQQFTSRILSERTEGAVIVATVNEKISSINRCNGDVFHCGNFLHQTVYQLATLYPYRFVDPYLVKVVNDLSVCHMTLHYLLHSFYVLYNEFRKLTEAPISQTTD